MLILTLSSSAVSALSSTKECLKFLFIFFWKRNEWRSDVRFPKDLGSKLKFHKNEALFCRWKSDDYNGIYIFLSLENSCTFLLAKWRAKERTVNYRKIIQKNSLCLPKQQYIVYLMIWCNLLVVCFEQKIGVFNK